MNYQDLNLPSEIKLTNSNSIAELYSTSDIVRAIVQSIPSVGSMLDALLASPGSKLREERLEFFLKTLFKAIQVLNDRLNIHLSETEEFHDSMWIAVHSSMDTRVREKIIMNVMVLTNLLSVPNSGYISPDDYLKILSELTPLESKIVALFYRTYKGDSQSKDDENELQRASRLNIKKIIREATNISEEDEILFHLKRLERTGLIREITGAYFDYSGGSFAPSKVLDMLMDYLSLHPFSKIDLSRL